MPIQLILDFNKYAKNVTFQTKTFNICEICYKSQNINLLCCKICFNYYHASCLNLQTIPNNFICPKCSVRIPNSKKIFKESAFEEITPQINTISQITSNNNNQIYCTGIQEKIPVNIIINNIEPKTTNTNVNKNSKSKKKRIISKKRNREPNSKKEAQEETKDEDNNTTNNTANQNQKTIEKKKGSIKKSDTKNMTRKEQEVHIMNGFDHNNPVYKRRRIKIGKNHNIDMKEFEDRYMNQIQFDDDEYERNQLKEVYSSEKNPLTDKELDDYIKTARLFWNYRNMYIESQLCADFYEESESLMSKQKIGEKLKAKIKRLLKELKNLVRRGVDLNCHYDEIALKMLHLCKYKQKVALLFLFKNLNPFIEEIEEGFKSDVTFFQSEIISYINNGDYELDE